MVFVNAELYKENFDKISPETFKKNSDINTILKEIASTYLKVEQYVTPSQITSANNNNNFYVSQLSELYLLSDKITHMYGIDTNQINEISYEQYFEIFNEINDKLSIVKAVDLLLIICYRHQKKGRHSK